MKSSLIVLLTLACLLGLGKAVRAQEESKMFYEATLNQIKTKTE